MGILTNSEYSDEGSTEFANIFLPSWTEIHHNLDNLICDPSKYTTCNINLSEYKAVPEQAYCALQSRFIAESAVLQHVTFMRGSRKICQIGSNFANIFFFF